MKLLKTIFLILVLALLVNCKKSEDQISYAHKEINLPTIQCRMCKSSIENKVSSIEGVKSIVVNLEDKKGHVEYQESKVSIEIIENAISALGYQANDLPGNPEAYANLPECCKIPE